MKKYLIITFFLFALMNSYCFAAGPMQDQHQKNHDPEKKQVENQELSGKLEDGVRVIEVKASRYKFEPDPILVMLGEKVRLVVTSSDVDHGIAISDFNVNIFVPAGKTETVDFTADKRGAFHAYCSVYCGPGHGRMEANFIVK